MTRQLFVNLPVKDIKHSKDFFERIGFRFHEHFTNEFAACIEVNDNAFVMLLVENYFSRFTQNEVCNAKTHNEVMCAISLESKEKVDEITDRALSIGATIARDTQDHGFMYSRSFYDLDGHVWEFYYMDINKK